MANVQKYARAALGHMLQHYERAKIGGEYVRFSNTEIAPELTELNYNLAPEHADGQLEFVKRRCAEVHCLKRSDVKVMCSWVVTAPLDVDPDDHERFFQITYRALENRYGRENVISAYVHHDEMRPHMHFSFIPVVWDKKHERYTVSAKQVLNRQELQKFHPWLSAEVERELGYKTTIMNGVTEMGNKSVAELKRQEAYDEVKRAQEWAAEIRAEAEEALEDLLDRRYALDERERKIEAREKYVDDLEDTVREQEATINSQNIEIMALKLQVERQAQSLRTFMNRDEHELG